MLDKSQSSCWHSGSINLLGQGMHLLLKQPWSQVRIFFSVRVLVVMTVLLLHSARNALHFFCAGAIF